VTVPQKHPKSLAKIIAACVFGVLVLMLAAHFLSARGGGEPPDEAKAKPVLVDIAIAQIGAVDTVVTAQGTLIPSQGFCARVAAPSGGRLTSVSVREGDRVKAGQVLAVVDSRVQSAQAQSAASALRVSELQAKQAKLAVQVAATDHANSVEVARLDLQMAQTELAKLKNGARPQEVAQAEQAVKQAQATRDRAATEIDRAQVLYDKGIAPKRQLDDAKTALSVAESTLESARQQLAMVRAGARSEDLQSAELRVKSAKAALSQAQHGALQVAAKQRESEAASVSIQQKQADLTAAQATAGYSTLRSPIAGVVTRRSLNPGDVADPATPVVEICDSHALDLSANIPAEDGVRIRTGMPVRVSATAAPGQTFAGRVISLGQVDPQSGLLAVRITVNNPGSVLKVGVFATADIVLGANPRAIVVPKKAVVTREDKSVVFVVTPDNKAHEREVKLGVEQGTDVEIIRGVAVGDRVISLGQYELTDGAEVKPSTGGAKGEGK
jgi:HlyD family secretion protein